MTLLACLVLVRLVKKPVRYIPKRYLVFTHLKSIHRNEISEKTANGTKTIEGKYDCGFGSCKRLYYKAEEKKYWCQKCFRISQIPKPEGQKVDVIRPSKHKRQF